MRKKIFTFLLALATSVGLLNAQSGGISVTQFNVPDEWESAETKLLVSDLPGFGAADPYTTQRWNAVPSSGYVYLIYAFESDGRAKYHMFSDGVRYSSPTKNIWKPEIFSESNNGTKFYYTTGPSNWGPEELPQVSEITNPPSEWYQDNTYISTVEMPGFVTVDDEIVKAWDGAPQGSAILISSVGNEFKYHNFRDGVYQYTVDDPLTRNTVYFNITDAEIAGRFFYTTGTIQGGSTPTVDPEPTADGDKLPGAFSVSGEKVVYFSKGNLQYTKSTGKWKIMEHQYDVVETLNQNVGTDYEDQDVVTLFGWGTSGHNSKYPYMTSSTNSDYGPSISSGEWTSDSKDWDWGEKNSSDLGAGWRTLTNAEWGYLFNSRTPGNSVNGVSNARYTEATINTDGTAVNGIILFPDDAVMTSVDGVTWGTINGTSAWTTTCTIAGWTALETAGCVFLPAVGDRNGTTVDYAGSYGFYWSSSAYSATHAYSLCFGSGYVNPQDSYGRYNGYSVRLVSETAPSGGSTPTGLQVIELQVPDSWENDQQLVIVPDLPGFVVFSLEEAGTWAAPEGYAHLIYNSRNNEGVRVTYFNNGVWGQEYVAGITRATVFGWASSGHRIFYTTDGSEPTPDPDPTTSGSCGANVTWEFDPSTGALTITGTGAMDDYLNNASAPWNSYITNITSVTITDGVTNVGNHSFEQCKSLTTVTIGDDVETIGTFAFSECGEQFTTLTLGNSIRTIGNQAFASNNGITGFTLPSTLETIGNFAFIHNSAITTLTIPSNVTSIDADAFYGCTAVTDVYCYPNAADLTWNDADCDDFKSGKATICHVNSDQLDAYQTKFNDVVRVTFVGDLDAPAPTPAPAGLQVTEWQIPDSWQNDNTLVTISDLPGFVAVSLEEAETWDAAPAGDVILIYTGKNNDGVTAICFNNGVWDNMAPFGGFTRADIFEWASYGYKNFYTSGGSTPAVDPAVQNVIDLIDAIPNPVAYNDECKDAIDAARAAYDALTDAQKALVENYGALLDAETAYAQLTPTPSGECGAQGDNLLWELNTSTGVLTITGSGAMADWNDDTQLPWYSNRLQITSVVLPEGLTVLGVKAFRGCTNLASINMTENYPAGLTAIKQEAFCHTALTSVTIPESVVSIEQDAFYLSKTITDVYCYADPNNLTWVDYYCDDFANDHATVCHVKSCYLDTYQTNWGGTTYNTSNSGVNLTFTGDLPGDCGGSTPTPTPSGDKLPGAFTVDNTGKQVNFSKGNVQYVGGSWKFADNQWDMIGNAQANDNRDLFGWGTGSEPNKTTEYEPYYTTFTDWGSNFGEGWRTMTKDEWIYLLETRDNAANLRTLATVNSVKGLILMPDGWTASGVTLAVTIVNYTSNMINESNWATLASQGCVFLPAAGYRVGNEVSGVGSEGYYFSSTNHSDNHAAHMSFETYTVAGDQYTFAYCGNSVRLVTDAGGSTPTPTAVETGDNDDAETINTKLEANDGQTVDEWTIVRPVYRNTYYNTLCLPFDMDAAQIAASSIAGAEIKEFTGAEVVGDELLIDLAPVDEIEAGKPYFIKYSNADALTQLDFTNVTIDATAPQGVTFNGVTLQGTFVPFQMEAQSNLNYEGGYLFLGQNNQLFWPGVTNSIKPFRAYFYVDTTPSNQNGAPKYRGMPARFNEEQVATSIGNVQGDKVQSTKVLRDGQLIIIRNGVEYNANGMMVK